FRGGRKLLLPGRNRLRGARRLQRSGQEPDDERPASRRHLVEYSGKTRTPEVMKPPLPSDEVGRLAALSRYEILDTPPEKAYDDLTLWPSQTTAAPMARVVCVDSARQWFKSRLGIAGTETPRDVSFCGHAILGKDVMEVPDALADERFRDSPLVTGEGGFR